MAEMRGFFEMRIVLFYWIDLVCPGGETGRHVPIEIGMARNGWGVDFRDKNCSLF
jgi:hypothetical protein